VRVQERGGILQVNQETRGYLDRGLNKQSRSQLQHLVEVDQGDAGSEGHCVCEEKETDWQWRESARVSVTACDDAVSGRAQHFSWSNIAILKIHLQIYYSVVTQTHYLHIKKHSNSKCSFTEAALPCHYSRSLLPRKANAGPAVRTIGAGLKPSLQAG
jgi:hypothetical protein